MAYPKSVLASMTLANNILVLKVVLALAVNLGWGLPPPFPAQPGIFIFYPGFTYNMQQYYYMEDLARTNTVV